MPSAHSGAACAWSARKRGSCDADLLEPLDQHLAAGGVLFGKLGEDPLALPQAGQLGFDLPPLVLQLGFAAQQGVELALLAAAGLGEAGEPFFVAGHLLGDLLDRGDVLLQLLVEPRALLLEVAGAVGQPLELDHFLLQAGARVVDPAGRAEQLLAQAFEPRLGALHVLLGGGDPGVVFGHRAGGFVAFGQQVAGAFVERAERELELGGLLAALFGLAAALLEPVVELGGALAGALEEFLAAFDGGGQLGVGLVAGAQLLGMLVEQLAAVHQLGFALVQLGEQGRFAVGGVPQAGLEAVEPALLEGPAAEQDPVQQLAVFLVDLLVAAGGAGLALERAQRAVELGDDVVDAQQVGEGLLELDLGDPLALAVAGDAGRLLDQAAPLLRLAREDHADLALLDHRIGADAQAGVHQEVLDVAQPHLLAVDPVAAFAAPEDLPLHHDHAVDRVLGRGVGLEGEADLGHPHRRPFVGAVEDDVFHLVAAQALGRLLAEHPGDRVRQVRLAAAVGPDDRGDARREAHLDLFEERFEPGDLETV